MMNTPSPDDTALLREQARAWLVRLNSGQVTPEQASEFKRWCRLSPAHAQAWREVAHAWSVLEPTLQEALVQNPAFAGDKNLPGRLRGQHKMRRRQFLGGALAASFAGVMALRPPLDLWPSVLDLGADYRTARGEQRAVALADGLTVQMNTQTRVNWQDRQADAPAIELLAGEAEIDAARQVQIRAGSGLVQARHARLNVRFLDDHTVCVTCLEGQADVRLAHTYPLTPGGQLTYDAQGVLAQDSVDPVQVSAWRTGMLSFVDVPLVQVVDELNRYRPGKIIIQNAALEQQPIRMTVSIHKTEGALSMLQELYGVQVKPLAAGVVLLA